MTSLEQRVTTLERQTAPAGGPVLERQTAPAGGPVNVVREDNPNDSLRRLFVIETGEYVAAADVKIVDGGYATGPDEIPAIVCQVIGHGLSLDDI